MSGKVRNEEDKSRDSEIKWQIVFVSCSFSAIHLLRAIIIQIVNIILHAIIIIQIVNIISSYFPSGSGRHSVQLQTVFLAYYSLCSIFLFLFRWLWKIFEDIVFGSTLALLSTLRAVKTSTSNPHTATGLTLLPLFYFSFLSYHLFSIYLFSLFL